MSIGSRLREARNAKGMTQTELGSIISRTKSTIANYESDKSSPSVEDLSMMMMVLEVNANFIYQDYLSETKKPATKYDDGLTDSERAVALAYRAASEDDKAVVDAVLKKYLGQQQKYISETAI